MIQKVQITIDGKTIELPTMEAKEGTNVIDVRGLIAEGMFTYDPGFLSTASCDSAITYIDGDAGVLLYRGYEIEQLADNSNHLEVCSLLLNGELPSETELQTFVASIKEKQTIDSKFQQIFNGFTQGAHPMAMVGSAISGLAALFHEEIDITNADSRMTTSHRLIAMIPTLAAMAYKHGRGESFVEPDASLGYAENFLNMCFGETGKPSTISQTISSAMDKIFILHADHEQNASTSTVRLAGSSEANPFASIAAGIASLWGPAHGGANEAVIRMLMEMRDTGKPMQHYVDRAKDKKDRFRLMGFGHRIYKNYDPRAKILRDLCYQVVEKCEMGGENRKLLELALELETLALKDDYFKQRKLYPNVDFYSGIIYRAMGFPPSMFTALFATARTVGWIAQWNEMIEDPTQRIGRPRQLFTGASERPFVPVDKR